MVDSTPTLEGLLRTYRTGRYGNHYVLEMAELIVAPGQTQQLDGNSVRVPRERVAWVQELSQ